MAKKKHTDKELMQMAIDVMNKSVNEPRPDGKVPPRVGAVLLFPDGRIETAFRGELREGDHAEFIEYTALPERSAQRQLKKWVDQGLIVSEGAGPSTKYRSSE